MIDPRPAYRYTIVDIRNWVTQAVVQRSAAYVSKVSGLTVQNDLISGRVQGMSSEPYHVQVFFGAAQRPKMSCTCAAQTACHHIAAVLLKAFANRELPPGISPTLLSWIEDFRSSQKPKASSTKKSPPRRDAVFYVLEPAPTATKRPTVTFYKGRPDAEGHPTSNVSIWENVERALLQPPTFVDESDMVALRYIWMQRPKGHGWGPIPLSGKNLNALMEAVLATGRAYQQQGDSLVHLHDGEPRKAELVWQALDETWTVPALRLATTTGSVIPGEQPWYIDAATAKMGKVISETAPNLLARVFDLPPLSKQDRVVLASALQELAPDVPSPDLDAAPLRVINEAPQPLLRLSTIKPLTTQKHRGYPLSYEEEYDLVYPMFKYGEFVLYPGTADEFITLANGETVKVVRTPAFEQKLLKGLKAFDLEPIKPYVFYMGYEAIPGGAYGLASETAWPEFMQDSLPQLREQGWKIELPNHFRHHVVSVTAWQADLKDKGNGWFDLDLGIVVDNQRVALAPLLSALFKRDPRWLELRSLQAIRNDERVELRLADGARAFVAAERIKPLAQTLIDLFDGENDGSIRVSALDAGRLEQLDDSARWQFKGPSAVMAMARRLQDAGKVLPATIPQGFTLELRPYQREGLAWLQYLREHNLAGILADDMGLGKTAQTLAHLVVEKQAGRLDRPALVVLPTSLVFNWKREAAVCAPGLRVLALHGKDRTSRFADIGDYDVVLTTYPLVWRDTEALQAIDWHLLILDEAQTVKNAASKAAAALRELNARHRLCLTGTPLENHLGELWSLFDFLLPGFLGDKKSFTKQWRTPIEKQADTLRRDLLAKRIKPFILRRRKEDVAKELPAKTVVLRTVELSGGQRDLYETVRATVNDSVKEMIAAQGFKRSQIVILDALLKLRQVCCDPRLVKIDSARLVPESAKLELLADMLPELVDEGRRILIFSQFTQMLDLIAEQLNEKKLGFVRLDGQTQNRELAVNHFQSGMVPIFLLSLKAGGVGLNLTAADTVIHFDPWWNPAAENQATDRAHRLGQQKTVFVYKLVVAGSIEERIVALQEKKADLAAGILSEDHAGDAKFTPEDLMALLAPLE